MTKRTVAANTQQLIERWNNVARVLDKMPQHERNKHWDMATWGEKTDCGTVACAAGHCGLDPWFRRRGFKLEFTKGGTQKISDVKPFFGVEGSLRIFLNTARRSVDTVLGEVRDFVSELELLDEVTSSMDLPKIGAEWPEQGGIYAGARIGAKGQPNYLLIVGPAMEGFAPWQASKDWASKLSVGGHADFVLPDRTESLVLYSRVKKLFEPSWYWTSEQHADLSSLAWMQYFDYGNQGYNHKDDDYRARAVRRSPL